MISGQCLPIAPVASRPIGEVLRGRTRELVIDEAAFGSGGLAVS